MKGNHKHHQTRTLTWNRWVAMRNRCRHSKRYSHVSYWEEWDNYEAFVRDVGLCPSEEHQLDRIDNSGGYFPENVRWVTPSENSRNRKSNVLLTFRGETKCVKEWCEVLGVSEIMVRKRLKRGWSVERALTEPRVY